MSTDLTRDELIQKLLTHYQDTYNNEADFDLNAYAAQLAQLDDLMSEYNTHFPNT